MKILIIDDKKHEELRIELQKYEIILEQKEYIPDETEEGAYEFVVLCPESIEDLRRMFDTLIIRRMKPVILYEKADDRFINYCIKLGCVDVVRKPYTPEILAKRLCSVVESISSEENGEIDEDNPQISISVEDFIKRELKNANRSQMPVGLLAFSFGSEDCTTERKIKLITCFRKRLRDTDFVSAYEKIILIILPGCEEGELKIVERKLLDCCKEGEIHSFGLVKKGFQSKNPTKEIEDIIGKLMQGIKNSIHIRKTGTKHS